MSVTYDIKKLCESWWEKVADTTKSEQHRFAERFLALLGWEEAAPIALPGEAARLGTVSYLLRAGSHDSLAAHFVMPGALEPPSNVIERGLDFCETTRSLVDATRFLHVSYAYVTDLFRSYLYDVRAEELILYADSPAQFQQEFGDILARADIERGALEEVRRQPRSATARQLREWGHRWRRALMAESEASEEVAEQAIDRLIVLRYLIEHDILKRAGWRLQKRYQDLIRAASGARPEGCGKRIVALFHDIWFDWKADIFAHAPIIDAVLERDQIAAPLLREFSMLSRAKFTIATVLESFNYGEAAEKARVRMIPEETEERNHLLAKQTLDTIDEMQIAIDLAEEGYRSIFHWFDRLIALYEHLDRAYEARQTHAAPVPRDIDLFAWSAEDAKRPHALSDKCVHAAEKALVVYWTTPRQYRTARLLLYLHLISRYEQGKQRFPRFPQLEKALVERPRILDSDRKQIFGQPPAPGDWEVV